MNVNQWARTCAGLSAIAALGLFGCAQNERVASDDSPPPPVFRSIASSHSGVAFRNVVDENIRNYFDLFAYVYNGGGVGIGDINNDGLPDVYFTGNEVPNKLYLNKGNMRFEDISRSAGVEGTGRWNNGVTMVDINGDDLLDIYVCKGGYKETPEQRKNLLFINQGDLTFREEAAAYGLDEPGYSIHASFFDMDNDNDLDVYITSRPDSFDLPLTEMVRQKTLSPTDSRDKLYRNDQGKFTEIGRRAGITNNFGYALSIVTSDLNNDGFADIFVANDFAEGDYMYINQGDGTFRERIKEATNHISMYSMGTDIADINNDGWEDIMVSEMLPEDYKRSKTSMPSMDVEGFNALVASGMHKQYMHNALHLNQGNLFFSEISQLSGVGKTEWSWSCLLSDFDNDGLRDLFVANGYRRDVFDGDLENKIAAFINRNRHKYNSPGEMLKMGFKDFIEVYDPIRVTDYLFKNVGDLRFKNVSAAWGFHEPGFSNGAAAGDLDNDGDLDLVINRLDDEALVYENTSSTRNHYLKLKLNGPRLNRHGIGAKVTVYHGGEQQYFENKTVRGYLSSNDPVVHFGMGKVQEVDSIKVVWSDGGVNLLTNVAVNQMVEVDHADAKTRINEKKDPAQLFATADVLRPAYRHVENVVDEYRDQVLLPHTFSRSGPFFAMTDVNSDGLEDFYVGGASGQAGALYIQKDGIFMKQRVPAFEKDRGYEDMGAVFLDADLDGDADLYVVSGGSEFPEGSEMYHDRLYVNDGTGNFTLSARVETISSGSCVVANDVDGDGDVDLFRGGQVVPNTYPKDPRSYLLINEGGRFTDKTAEVAPLLSRAGMVNTAGWVDLDGDKVAELVVTGEWMPVRIFRKQAGKYGEVSSDFGLSRTEGWWNKLVADDLDMDGDVDLVVGNIGENYKFAASAETPFEVYANDFDGNGTNDIFLARHYLGSRLVPIRGRECSAQQMPSIARKFPTYRSFAQSDLAGILGKGMEEALHYKAHLFSSVILENDRGKFRIKRLPTQAQLSAVNGILVRDFDGDGVKDILLAGNKFDVEVETTPADASPGLFLKGETGLRFQPRKPFESGFFVPHNVKDLSAIQLGDGVAILVSINNGPVNVFVNDPARGLRVFALNE